MKYALVAFAMLTSTAAHAGIEKPHIVPRTAWAYESANTSLMHTQVPHGIIVHHSGEKRMPNIPLEEKLRGLQDFSMRPHIITETKREKPAWGDVPYHFYIDAHGRIGEGRAIKYAGDTNTGYDTDGYIQVVVEGHFDKEKPNEGQLQSLETLVLWLAYEYHIPAENITAHNDHAETDCPGRHLKPFLDILRAEIAGAP